MSASPLFEHSVFINCPFDDEFAPILQAIAFCVIDLGFHPRLAPENADGSATRLDRLVTLIRGSKYSIHDLSRCKAREVDEYARLNMPFELGIDYGARKFGDGPLPQKSMLILEETRFDYQKTLSDISGWDIEAHNGNHEKAIGKVRGWLVRHAGAKPTGTASIIGHYSDFQAGYWERELRRGASENDIKEYPTIDVVRGMQEWVAQGRPSREKFE